MAEHLEKFQFPCTIEVGRGLEGAVTNVSQVGTVNGEAGELSYRGIAIGDLCDRASFEETAYLLIFGKLPTPSELKDFERRLRAAAALPRTVLDQLSLLPRDIHPMNALQSGVAALAGHDPSAQEVTQHASDPAAALAVETEVATRLLARTCTAAGAIARLREGARPVPPDPELGLAACLLFMMSGKRPDEPTRRIMDSILVMQADHGMNTSAFTAMVVHSCLSDLYSTVAAAIGALRGPLHGGASELAFRDLESIGEPGAVERWVDDRLAAGRRIIGFGHRVYRTQDPRIAIQKRHAEVLCRHEDLARLYATACQVEEVVCARMSERGKKVFPNISFYAGILYRALGIPAPLFPVVFAVARTAGWLARVLEYLPVNRLFCPRAVYEGPTERRFTPLHERRM